MNTATKMKTFVILEKYVGYADVTIEAETEQEAIDLYNEGSYNDDEFSQIWEIVGKAADRHNIPTDGDQALSVRVYTTVDEVQSYEN